MLFLLLLLFYILFSCVKYSSLSYVILLGLVLCEFLCVFSLTIRNVLLNCDIYIYIYDLFIHLDYILKDLFKFKWIYMYI